MGIWKDIKLYHDRYDPGTSIKVSCLRHRNQMGIKRHFNRRQTSVIMYEATQCVEAIPACVDTSTEIFLNVYHTFSVSDNIKQIK